LAKNQDIIKLPVSTKPFGALLLVIALKNWSVVFSGDKKEKQQTRSNDQYPLPVQYIHLSLFIPPHWKIDTVVIRRSRSNVIISLFKASSSAG
jgi:hypothetical protein